MRKKNKYVILEKINRFFFQQNLQQMGAALWDLKLRKIRKLKGKVL